MVIVNITASRGSICPYRHMPGALMPLGCHVVTVVCVCNGYVHLPLSEQLITDTLALVSCTRRATESIEKRFCFDVIVQDRSASPSLVIILYVISEFVAVFLSSDVKVEIWNFTVYMDFAN